MSREAFFTSRAKLPDGMSDRLFNDGDQGGDPSGRPFASCLIPLLNALGWRGEPRHVSEAIPHFAGDLDLDGFRNVLANLNYDSEAHKVRQDDIDPALTPCLFVPDEGSVRVILSISDTGHQLYDSETDSVREDVSADLLGTAYYVAQSTLKTAAEQEGFRSWMGRIARRLRVIALQAFAITLIFNLLSVVTPLFVMSVYDSVIPSASVQQLLYLLGGIVLAVGFEASFRILRSRSLAYAAGRIDHLVGVATFQQVMFLPALQTENAPLGTQIARLKEFEVVRDFFTGPLAEALLDIPFAIVFIVIIAVLGGPIAIIPIAVAVLYIALAMVAAPLNRRLTSKSGTARSTQQRFLVEAMVNLRNVKLLSAQSLWLDRHRKLSAVTAEADFKISMLNHTIQAVSTILMLSAGVGLIAFGAMRVIDGTMSSGALIAVMILGWRALSPLQSGLTALSRAEQIRMALSQINRLMRLPVERMPGDVPPLRYIGGGITFSTVSFRYTPETDPALFGVAFDAKPGEVVAISGHNGCGASTVLKLAAGIHKPQAGAVFIDGVDVRQLDAIDLRQQVGFAPQTAEFFHGTIAQNLLLAMPTATKTDMTEACRAAHLYDEIMVLPNQFETRLTDAVLSELPSGFKRKLALARAYIRKAPILLLDEPAQALDADADEALMNVIRNARGKTTVLMTTHRPSHMRLADRLILLNGGRVAFAGPPGEFLDRKQKSAA